jgi:hypothetical protein
MLARLSRQAWLWSAYWRLYPLWDVLRQVVPEIELPTWSGMRWNIRYRLHRRVIEIRDAQLVLRPYSAAEVAHRAAAAAQSSGLSLDAAAVVVEAAVIASSIRSRQGGSRRLCNGIPWDHISAVAGNDVRAEAVALIMVCRAIRCSPVVREAAGWAPGRMTLLGRVAERVLRRRHSC